MRQYLGTPKLIYPKPLLLGIPKNPHEKKGEQYDTKFHDNIP